MTETLTLLPMAPGTRSRRADIHRRATPVLLPKQKLQQTTLDQYQTYHQQRLTRPSPQQQPPAPPLPQQQKQQQLSFSIASPPTRSVQNILNYANSMRSKRKLDTQKGADNDNNNNSDIDYEAALRKRPKLAVEIYSKPPTPTAAPAPSVSAAVPQAATAPTTAVPLPKTIGPNTTGSASGPTKGTKATKATKAATTTTQPPSSRTVSKPTTSAAATAASPVLSPSLASSRSSANKRQSHSSQDKSHNGNTTTPDAPSLANHQRTAGHPPPKNTPQLAVKHKEKVVNGIKQELKGLQVSAAKAVAAASGPPEGGRKLRSQEATRFKSELSAYFPDYDEVIGNDPKEEHILNIDTPIILVESSSAHSATASSTSLAGSLRSGNRTDPAPVRGYGDKLFYDVFDSHVLDFTFLGNQHKGKGAVDPLPDSYFEPHHKRAERLERSIRNSEKGRAQHEKDQIVRLLEGLQGHDWLRTMGVSGITESKKKTFEPAREHFIRGCRAILEKFRLWGLEEKRRKLEKDRAHAEEVKAREAAAAAAAAETNTREQRGKGKAKVSHASGSATEKPHGGMPKSRKRRDPVGKDGDDANEDEKETARHKKEEEDADGHEADSAGEGGIGGEEVDDDSQPDSSDFDAVIARQLREEALARSRLASGRPAANKRRKTRRSSSTSSGQNVDASGDSSPKPKAAPKPKPRGPPQEDVKSFFRKRYQREAALSRSRRKGRTVLAWGEPVPELPEVDFDLPGEILDKEDMKPHGRNKRGSARDTRK